MKKIAKVMTFIAVIASAVPAFADTLVLKNGEKVTGYYEGGTARVIKFRAADGAIKDYRGLELSGCGSVSDNGGLARLNF